MTQAVRDYLLGVVAAAMMSVIVLTLVPKGTVHRTLTFLCGMTIILAALGPIAKLDFDHMAQSLAKARIRAEEAAGGVTADNTELIAELIKEKTESYIWDKADGLGFTPTGVTAEIRSDGSYPYPYSVEISGVCTPEQRDRMTRDLEQNLAIPAQRQEWHTYEKE